MTTNSHQEILQAFARRCALDVAHYWACPALVREYLRTGDPVIREAAESIARANANYFETTPWAREAAEAAAEAATRNPNAVAQAQKVSAMSARAVAKAAVNEGASSGAVRVVVREEQLRRLTQLVEGL